MNYYNFFFFKSFFFIISIFLVVYSIFFSNIFLFSYKIDEEFIVFLSVSFVILFILSQIFIFFNNNLQWRGNIYVLCFNEYFNLLFLVFEDHKNFFIKFLENNNFFFKFFKVNYNQNIFWYNNFEEKYFDFNLINLFYFLRIDIFKILIIEKFGMEKIYIFFFNNWKRYIHFFFSLYQISYLSRKIKNLIFFNNIYKFFIWIKYVF